MGELQQFSRELKRKQNTNSFADSNSFQPKARATCLPARELSKMPAGRERCMVPGSFGRNSELKTHPFGQEGAAHGEERERLPIPPPEREASLHYGKRMLHFSARTPHAHTAPHVSLIRIHTFGAMETHKSRSLNTWPPKPSPCPAPSFLNTLNARTPVARPSHTNTHSLPSPTPIHQSRNHF